MPETVPGIHHVTAITADAQRNVDFYVSVLGLRFVKKTVNFDVPDTYHLYYGDWLGTPGTAMTFFAWPHLGRGRQGSGQVTLISFGVPDSSVAYWAVRLRQLGLEVSETTRFDVQAIAFRDPDGMQLELVGAASDARWVPWRGGPVDPVHAIRGFHSVTLCVDEGASTVRFLRDTMGFRQAGGEDGRTRYETGDGEPGALVDVLEAPDGARGEEAAGTVHHVAWRTTDESQQLAWRETLVGAGRQVTPVIDRKYFRSIYYREPGGVLFEIATDQPGFTVDEAPEALGSALKLPPQYEGRRDKLNLNLPPIVVPTTATSRAEL